MTNKFRKGNRVWVTLKNGTITSGEVLSMGIEQVLVTLKEGIPYTAHISKVALIEELEIVPSLTTKNFLSEIKRKLAFTKVVIDRRGVEFDTRIRKTKRNAFELIRVAKTTTNGKNRFASISGVYDDESVLIHKVSGTPNLITELIPYKLRRVGNDVPLADALEALY